MPSPRSTPHALLRLGFKLGAWFLALAIVAMTVGPIDMRPHMAAVSTERSGAFFVLGLFFVLAYPRRPWLAATILLGGAAVLEAMQRLVPGRHGHWDDLAIKAIGGLAGVLAAQALLYLYRRMR